VVLLAPARVLAQVQLVGLAGQAAVTSQESRQGQQHRSRAKQPLVVPIGGSARGYQGLIASSAVGVTHHPRRRQADRPAQHQPCARASLPGTLTVEAIQANDHPASGEPVIYTVHGPAVFVVSHIGTDTLQVVTGADGQAAADLYPKYNETGPVTVTASSPDFGSVTFTETVASH
jgi:hypothetical protein